MEDLSKSRKKFFAKERAKARIRKSIFQQGERSIYQLIRANGADTVYMSFGAMLKDFLREDLIELYRLEDWDAIRAKLEANAELTKNVLGKELPEKDFAKKMVELVNQRKKFFAK
ncbi:hypothetical protein Tco_0564266 [Tanacetum coccineum]